MFCLNTNIGRTVTINDKEYLFFSGYDYLGLQQNKAFKQIIQEGIENYGWLFPSSRISNTPFFLYEEFESLLSSITQTKNTISFSSGYLAGNATKQLFTEHTKFIYPTAHPAINHQNLQITNFNTWLTQTIETINTTTFKNKPVIVCDAVSPLTATVYDFNLLKEINKEVIVIIDDSHGIGIIGENGKGISSMVPKNNYLEYVFVYSLSKAFNLNAGAISCTSKETAYIVRKLPEFTASTPIAPYAAYAFMKAQNIYQNSLNSLKQNIAFTIDKLKQPSSVYINPQLPIILLPENLDEDFFKQKDIIISSFSYSTSQGKKINRAVLNALHTENDVEKLINSFG